MDGDGGSVDRHLFTVRIWREKLGGYEAEWRGQAQYVGNGEWRAFRDWSALIAFIQTKLTGAEDKTDLA